MKFNYKLLMLLALPLITNCKKDEPEPETPKGNISGSVVLYDEATTMVSDSGMTVYVDGYESKGSVTDTGGVFLVAGIPLGTHTLLYTKDGYGTFKIFDFEIKEQNKTVDVVEIPNLGKKSPSAVTNLVNVVQGTDVNLFISTDPQGSSSHTTYVRVFLSTDAGVSNTNYQGFTDVVSITSNPGFHTLTQAKLKSLGFTSGSTLYAKAYGESVYSNDYVDPADGVRVFPNENPTAANAVNFLMP